MILVKTLVVGPLGANCYIVVDESTRNAIVIDPGDEADRIERAIHLADAKLQHIVLTHGHPDHTFAAGDLGQRFDGANVLMHKADLSQLDDNLDLVAMFYDMESYIPPEYGTSLADGDELSVGSSKFKVIHTPGHTPGGVCLYGENAVFTGDTLFARGIGRTDLPGGSYPNLISSIRERLLVLPEDTVVYPGHGEVSTIGIEREQSPWVVT